MMLHQYTAASTLLWASLLLQQDAAAFSPVARNSGLRRSANPSTRLFEYIDSGSGAGNLTDSFGGATVETTTVEPLTLANLGRIANNNKAVATPTFDISQVSPGILHLGMGNFHRSHLAAYVEDVMNDPSLFENNKQWGIVGSGIRSNNKRDEIKSQDYLQTLVERDGTSSKAMVMASMIDFIPLEQMPDLLQNSPEIKIVSITATEGGYFLDKNGEFNANDADIQYDIANPTAPKTIFGKIVQGLAARQDSGLPAFTVLSCDNLPHNGEVTKGVLLGLAQSGAWGAELAAYIEENVSCPNSMVDRITPQTTDAMRDYCATEFGVDDVSPVFCEPFRQWIVQDDFCQGRPEFEKLNQEVTQANIAFVDDVAPYELMKIRILNGGHASLCYPSALLGVEYVHNSMEHPTISAFLDKLERNELIPTVPPVPDGTDLPSYWDIIAERFANPTIDDTIARNCYDGASRQPKFIVPPAKDALEMGGKIDGLALVSAMWCRYCEGTTESGEPVPSTDPQWDRLTALAKRAKEEEPALWLTELNDVYGDVVGQSPVFAAAFTKALNKIYADGVEAAMKEYISKN